MSALEERIREAYRSIDTYGPLSAPPLASPRRGKVRMRWAAPVAAAVAVSAVVAGGAAYVSTRHTGQHEPVALTTEPIIGRGSGKAEPLPLVSVLPPATTGSVGRPVPRFALVKEDDNPTDGPKVRDVATGKVIDQVRLAAARVAGVGDGRTFFAAVSPNDDGATFYRITLGADGKVASTAKLPVPGVASGRIDSMAASEDGGTIAFDVQHGGPSGGQNSAEVRVADVRSGRTVRWPGSTVTGPVMAMSMDRTGRWLAMESSSAPSGGNAIRILDTHQAGTDLSKASTLVVAGVIGAVALSPDASTFAVSLSAPSGGYQIVSYESRTGRRLAPLLQSTTPQSGGDNTITEFDVLQYDPSGTALLLHGGGYATSVRQPGGKITPIGDPARQNFASTASW